MIPSEKQRVLWPCLALMCLGLTSFRISTDADDTNSLARQLAQTLDEQAASWNRGDIPSFMSAYWQSPNMTFSAGGTTERGWQATLDRYLKRYPTQEAMGHLTFRNLETTQLAPDVALTLGDWHLEKKEPANGNFSLVWKRIDDGWRIIHDHSSSSVKTTQNESPSADGIPPPPIIDEVSPQPKSDRNRLPPLISELSTPPSLSQIQTAEMELGPQFEIPKGGIGTPAVAMQDLSKDPVFQELKRAFLDDKARPKEQESFDPSQLSDGVWHSAEQLLTAARKLEAEEKRLRDEGNIPRAIATRKSINAIRLQVTTLLLSPEEK